MTIEDVIKSNITLNPYVKTVLNIMYSGKLVEEKIAEVLKPYDLSPQQYNVLRILRGQKGKPANLSTIQERMISKMSNTTRLVDKLLAKDFVKRSICEINRRKVDIIITPLGLSLLETLDPQVLTINQTILKDFSIQELNTINNILDKLKH